MANLIQRGIRMTSFADKDPTLEDVFMMVTKGLVT
jgi:ABC-2 type transport system ATP-binding protein